jgi:hypothetical protein
MNEEISKIKKAVILLAEHIDRVNANSNAPYSSDLEEKIKKILE